MRTALIKYKYRNFSCKTTKYFNFNKKLPTVTQLCWGFIYFINTSKQSSTVTASYLCTNKCPAPYAESWCQIWMGSGDSSWLLGHKTTCLSLWQRHLPVEVTKIKQNKKLLQTVSAITYCNGTLYKITIRSRNTWLIYKKQLKAIRKLESNFNFRKVQSYSSEQHTT